MKRTQLLEEIRKMRFEDVYTQQQSGHLSTEEAACLLGMSARNMRRYIHRYKAQGIDGLRDKRLAKAAHNAAPVDEVIAMTELYKQSYRGYSTAHFYDKYRHHHAGNRCYNWVRQNLYRQGVKTKKKKQGKHRLKRHRCPMVGMRIHQDGSTHQWVEGKYWDLIVTMDDANNEIYSAFFTEEEGTMSSFQGVKEVIETKGLFCSFYSDRGSHYWHTPQTGGKVDKNNPTQFGRAMKRLGIDMIAAYSPQAQARSERMFGTLQKRLPLELKSAGITDMSAANVFLKKIFLPEFNQRFKVEPSESISAFVAWQTENIRIDHGLCLESERIANKDNTVAYKGMVLQIPSHPSRYSYAKMKIKVKETVSGSVLLCHGPRVLVEFKADDIKRLSSNHNVDEHMNTFLQAKPLEMNENKEDIVENTAHHRVKQAHELREVRL